MPRSFPRCSRPPRRRRRPRVRPRRSCSSLSRAARPSLRWGRRSGSCWTRTRPLRTTWPPTRRRTRAARPSGGAAKRPTCTWSPAAAAVVAERAESAAPWVFKARQGQTGLKSGTAAAAAAGQTDLRSGRARRRRGRPNLRRSGRSSCGRTWPAARSVRRWASRPSRSPKHSRAAVKAAGPRAAARRASFSTSAWPPRRSLSPRRPSRRPCPRGGAATFTRPRSPRRPAMTTRAGRASLPPRA
mmetsp:Transcript_10488/g.24388  ORF Transcript_10488/g.24388 Transcript_10488/m.24388 type:complete len:243 (-) Transcript_10488:1362-2090(-)